MKMHFVELSSIYGEQTLVNLVNQKGHERPVKEAFERYVAQVNVSLTILVSILIELVGKLAPRQV